MEQCGPLRRVTWTGMRTTSNNVLGADVVAGLEKLLAERFGGPSVPPSPHVIERPAAAD